MKAISFNSAIEPRFPRNDRLIALCFIRTDLDDDILDAAPFY